MTQTQDRIAIVTPIQEVTAIMNGERLTSERKRKAREYMKQHAPTLDAFSQKKRRFTEQGFTGIA